MKFCFGNGSLLFEEERVNVGECYGKAKARERNVQTQQSLGGGNEAGHACTHTHTLKGNTGTGAGATAGKVHIMFPLNIISQREPRMQMLPKLESFHLIYLFIYFLHSFLFIYLFIPQAFSAQRVSVRRNRGVDVPSYAPVRSRLVVIFKSGRKKNLQSN